MTTYLRTIEETRESAEQAQKENFETYIKECSVQCDCGESFACILIDEKTDNALQEFVYCEACHNYNS